MMILYNFFVCLLNPYLLYLLCFSFLYTFKRHFFIILFIVYFFLIIIFQNACSRARCNNNAICQSGFTSKGYRCLCSVGFAGAHCEQGEK